MEGNLSVALTTTTLLSHAFPESIRFDWTLDAVPPSFKTFGSCSAPHPSLNLTGLEPFF